MRQPLGEALARQLLDAMPGWVFLVDDDVTIMDYNSSAGRLLGAGPSQILRRRGGDVLHCVHAKDVAAGCGRGEFCKTCFVRDSVNKAMAGIKCVQRRVRLHLEAGTSVKELYILVSAARLEATSKPKVLLILQEIGEVLQLQGLCQVCLRCKRIQDEHRAWTDVGGYLKRHVDLLLEHCYCPDCQAEEKELAELRQRLASLTGREREVYCLVAAGRPNKHLAQLLGIAETTVKVHRGRVMRKMCAQSVAELVQIAGRLGLVSKRDSEGINNTQTTLS